MVVSSLKQLFIFIAIICVFTHYKSDVAVAFAKPVTRRDLAQSIEYYLNVVSNESTERIIKDQKSIDVQSTTMTPTKNVTLINRAMASAPETCEAGKKMDNKKKACRVDLG